MSCPSRALFLSLTLYLSQAWFELDRAGGGARDSRCSGELGKTWGVVVYGLDYVLARGLEHGRSLSRVVFCTIFLYYFLVVEWVVSCCRGVGTGVKRPADVTGAEG